MLSIAWGPYAFVNLSKDNKTKVHRVHRLVAETFIPKVLGKEHVNHIDNDIENNAASNLEWCTPEENIQWSSKQGRMDDKGIKKVFQFDLVGNFVEEYPSIKDASKKTGVSFSMIGKCASPTDRVKTAGGFIWKFDNNPMSKEEVAMRTKRQPNKRQKQSSATL